MLPKARVCITTLMLLLCHVLVNVANAGEGGGSTYVSGYGDIMIGVQPPPGTYFKNFLAYSAVGNRTVDIDAQIDTDASAHVLGETLLIANISKTKVFGSYWGAYLFMRGGHFGVGADVVEHGTPSRVKDDVTGLIDTAIFPLVLGYNRGMTHFTTYTGVYVPDGRYSIHELANPGQNRWAVEQDLGVTWYNEKTGYEASGLLGYTIPFNNAATDYKSGQELHLDYALAKHLENKFVYGIVGYWFQQTTPDKGSGAKLGAFKGQAIALGPIFAWSTPGERSYTFTLKYYHDVTWENRLHGSTIWFNVSGQL